ncbi:MAG: DUF1761 domain-containing protein [Bacteroidetes bacterium]|nr:DUF1761 domain-containing protein [Bacteroidota bacterium]
MEISNVNFIALAIAAIASFGLGAAWYSPFLFGKSWQKELGFTDEYLKKGNMLAIFGSSLLLIFLMDFGLAIILQGHAGREVNALSGSLYGLLIGVFFVATSIAINVLYQRKSFKLWAIDAGYQVLYLAMTGAILGNWR